MSRLWHKNKHTLRLLASGWLLLFLEAVHTKSTKTTPRKMASALKIPWQHVVHFCCAKFCHSNLRLFLISPPPVPSKGPLRWNWLFACGQEVATQGGGTECGFVDRLYSAG